jgi:hypothetical protein
METLMVSVPVHVKFKNKCAFAKKYFTIWFIFNLQREKYTVLYMALQRKPSNRC